MIGGLGTEYWWSHLSWSEQLNENSKQIQPNLDKEQVIAHQGDKTPLAKLRLNNGSSGQKVDEVHAILH